MRHRVDGRKFGRTSPHRKAMLQNLANAVIREEMIVTTEAKAKETRRVVDRLITLAKRGNPHARRLAFDRTRDKDVVGKIFDTLVERYKDRKGGYTRVLKIDETRRGDAARMAMIELVDRPELDRKRTKAAEGSEKPTDQAPVDPFKRFRKLFRGNKQAAEKVEAQ